MNLFDISVFLYYSSNRKPTYTHTSQIVWMRDWLKSVER